MLLRRRNLTLKKQSGHVEYHPSKSHLDKIRGLGDLAVPHIRPVDGEKSVVRLDPSVQSGDGVLQDLYDEDARLWAAAADPDAEVFARLSLEADRHHVLVVPEAGGPGPAVLLYPLPVHSQPQHAGHLPQSCAYLTTLMFSNLLTDLSQSTHNLLTDYSLQETFKTVEPF